MGGFFWFLIGAGTATIWGRNHQWQDRMGPQCDRRREQPASQQWGPAPPATPAEPAPQAPVPQSWGMWGRPAEKADNALPQAQAWGPWGRQDGKASEFKPWTEQDVRKFRQDAETTVSPSTALEDRMVAEMMHR